MVRLQKFLAEAGVASRRAGEKLIVEGRVSVNGHVVTELGSRIDPAKDRVVLDGQALRSKRKLYIAIHKPKGYLSTRLDPSKRRVVLDLLPLEWRNLYPVGRLDMDTEGLLFLTNDGQFALQLTHPRYGIRKLYRVWVEGPVDSQLPTRLASGVEDHGETLKATRVGIVSTNKSKSVVEVELAEGKNREIRRMFEVLGHTISRLQRIQIGPIKLGELPVAKWRTLTETEIKSLLRPL